MTNFQTFDELFQNTQQRVIEWGTASHTVLKAQERGFRLLKPLMEKNNILFSKEIALEWLNKTYEPESYPYITYRRLINLLDDNLHGKLTETRIVYRKKKKPLQNDNYMALLNEYEQFLKNSNYRQATIHFKYNCAKEVLYYMESIGVTDLRNWNHSLISQYLRSDHFQNRKPDGVKAERMRLRHFLDYLLDSGKIDKKLSEAVLTYTVEQRRIVTTMSPETQEILLRPMENSITNKRDKAISLIALRCGLRTKDILELKFENVNPQRRELNIIQSKNQTPLTRYIPNDAFNALIDYICHERRKSDSPYIFLCSKGPLQPLKGSVNMGRHFKDVDKSLWPDEMGLHILRRTNGSDLAKAGMEINKVAKALGHTSPHAVDCYLSTDEKKMRDCALEIGPFEYTGGLF